MPVTGQPKDPEEALLAGRPLMFTGEDEEGSLLSLGTPENVVLQVHQRDDDGTELVERFLADDVKERWNLYHDLVAQVEALATAVRGLLPFAQERATQFRERAKKLAEFVKETGTTPSDAVEAMRKLRETEADGAELVLEQARQALRGASHG